MTSKEKIIQSAEKLLKAGKIDRAIREYQKLLSEDPDDMRTKLKIADLFAKKKDNATALKTYREVAEAYAKENFHLKSIAVYKTILKLNPTLVQVNEKLGELYFQVGLDHDAINQFYIVAAYYDSKGMVKEALEIRRKIVQIDPSNTTSRIRLAELMQADGAPDQSLHEYEKTAEILASKKDREGLIEVYEKILYFKPDNIPMLKELCQIYFERREFKKALKRIEGTPPAVRKNPEILEISCEALLEERQVDAARRGFRDLFALLVEAKDSNRLPRVWARIRQEFSDDLDYLKELEDLQKEAGIVVEQVTPKYRQDFEKTQMVDLAKLEETLKGKK